jgi:hypothetical protein
MRKKGVLIICTVCLIIITVGYSIKNGDYFLKKTAVSKLPNNALVEAKESSEDLLTGELKLKDFEIMGINLGQTVDEVKQILGEPECIQDTVVFANNNKDDYKRYIYCGIELEIFLPKMKVTDISIPMTGYKTSRGIQVGDSRAKIIKAYGNEYFESTFEDKDIIAYYYFEERKDPVFGDAIFLELWLHFVLENDIVTEIKIYEAWD